MIGLIDDAGYETPEFTARVHLIVQQSLMQRESIPSIGDFFVPAVVSNEGRVSYWGVIDVGEIPEEDVYVEAEARFYSALKCLDERNVADFGLVNIPQVVSRQPLPWARRHS